MTELQIGLIGLGATAVAGVFAFNKWQEYRQRKLAEAMLKPHHEDVLLGGGARAAKTDKVAEAPVRNEPVLEDDEVPVAVGRVEPVLGEPEPYVEDFGGVPDPEPEQIFAEPAPEVFAEPEPEQQPAPIIARREARPAAPAQPVQPSMPLDDDALAEAGPVPADLLDPRIEFVVAMELVDAVPAMQILHSQRSTLARLHKPVHWVGFNERSREWERLAPDSELPVRRLRVGLQLVNRMGPLSESDVVVFTNAMHALADELMAVANMPPVDLLNQAAEVDRFCAAVDLEIGVNLVSRQSAFPGTKIRALAEAAGMVLGVDGLFTRYDDLGRPQFSLQNYESTAFSADTLRTLTTHGLTFLMDVPRVDHGERVFMQMTEIARRFADTLNGALVDDNRQPLSDSQLEHIRREFIGKPQATMASFGLAAGSAQSLRLFS